MGGGKTPPKIPRKRYLLAQAGQLLLSRQFAIFSFRVLGLGTPFPRRGKGFFFWTLGAWRTARHRAFTPTPRARNAPCGVSVQSLARIVSLKPRALPHTKSVKHEVNGQNHSHVNVFPRFRPGSHRFNAITRRGSSSHREPIPLTILLF